MGRFWVGTGKNRHRTAAGIRHEYESYQSSEEAKKKRSARNSARRSAIRSGRVHKGDGKDIHHADHNPTNNASSNLKVLSAHRNRGIHEKSRKRGSKRKTKW